MEFKLKAEKRSGTGKGAARRTRDRGDVPAVMYGLKEDAVSLAVKKVDLAEAISGDAGVNVLLDLQVVDGKKKDNHLVMIKELQRHPFKEKLLHVDFLKVARDTKVSAKVPITIVGEEESVGLKAGGTLQHNLWEVEIECLPQDVPDNLSADVTEAAVGDHMTVADLEVPDGVSILTDPSDVVFTILAPRLITEEAEVEEEAAATEEEAAEAAGAAETAGGEEA